MIARCDNDDSLVMPVSPVGKAAAGELARCLLPANALVETPVPERLAVGGIDRGGDATRRRDGEESPIRVQRCGAIVLIVAELARVPLPRDLERAKIRRINLSERRIARAPCVGTPVSPLAGRISASELSTGGGHKYHQRERRPTPLRNMIPHGYFLDVCVSIRILPSTVVSGGSSVLPTGIWFNLSRYARTSAYSSGARLPGSFFGIFVLM